MTKSRIAILVLAAAIIATPVVAQQLGNSSDIVEPNTKPAVVIVKERAEKPVVIVKDPVLVSVPKCTQVTLKHPAIETKAKPASYSPTVRDSVDGLAEDMKTCNPNSEVVAFVKDSSKTVRIKVTQGADGVAYLKLPTERLARIMINFHVGTADWTKDRSWGLAAPVGTRTDLVLTALADKDAPKPTRN